MARKQCPPLLAAAVRRYDIYGQNSLPANDHSRPPIFCKSLAATLAVGKPGTSHLAAPFAVWWIDAVTNFTVYASCPPCNRRQRTLGETFRVIREALLREATLREQTCKPDKWLSDCADWLGRGCLP